MVPTHFSSPALLWAVSALDAGQLAASLEGSAGWDLAACWMRRRITPEVRYRDVGSSGIMVRPSAAGGDRKKKKRKTNKYTKKRAWLFSLFLLLLIRLSRG